MNRTIRQRAQASAKKQIPGEVPNMLTAHILRKLLEKAWMIGYKVGRRDEQKARSVVYDFREL